MSDPVPTRAVETPSPASKRDRSPNFPAIGLGRALERAEQLLTTARRYEVRLADAATAWGLGSKSSATLQTAAALIAYGLAEDSGSGEARKLKVSDLAWRILEDRRPGAREQGLVEAAMKPKLIAEFVARWLDHGRPADPIATSELKFDRGFTEEAAARFIRVYDETIQFLGDADSDRLSDKKTDTETVESDKPPRSPAAVKLGDYVQWTSSGVEQFRVPPQVLEVYPDGKHVRVFGSPTGIPITELTVVDRPAPTPAVTLMDSGELTAGASQANRGAAVFSGKGSLIAGAAHQPVAGDSQSAGHSENEFSVLQRGNRLQITADVDLDGIATLKEMLTDYESILRRLSGKRSE